MQTKSITKGQLWELLIEYNSNFVIPIIDYFCSWASSTGISALYTFVKQDLSQKASDEALNAIELDNLLQIIKNRYRRVVNLERNYRKFPTDATNVIYSKLILLLADNQQSKLLILKQHYNNDYCIENRLLCDIDEPIVALSSGYALPLSQILEHISNTFSLSHPIPKGKLEDAMPLDQSDLQKLRVFAEYFDSLVERIDERCQRYQNHLNLYKQELRYIPFPLLFITDNNFCFVISEMLVLFKSYKRLFNPYTKLPLLEKDVQELMALPDFQQANDEMNARQIVNAAKINESTLTELIKLADAFLTTHDFDRHYAAYETFYSYYQKLDAESKEALDDYWIEGWSEIDLGEFIVQGAYPIKFGDVHRAMRESCRVAGSLVKMILQLNPYAKFSVDDLDGKNIIAAINSTVNSTQVTYASFENNGQISRARGALR